jgi:hypothetical protein
MEVSVIGSSQAKIWKTDLAYRELGFSDLRDVGKVFSAKNRVSFGQSTRWRTARVRFALKAVQSEPLLSEKVSVATRRSKSVSYFFVNIYIYILILVGDALGCREKNNYNNLK